MQILLEYATCLLVSLCDVDDQRTTTLHEYEPLGKNFFLPLIISLLFVPSWCVPVTSYGFESTLNIIFLVALFRRLYVTLI